MSFSPVSQPIVVNSPEWNDLFALFDVRQECFQAISDGQRDVLLHHLGAHDALLRDLDLFFRYACCKGQLDIARVLLQRGADQHASDDDPLRMTTWTPDVSGPDSRAEVATFLLELGADPDARLGEPLVNVARNGDVDTAAVLIDYGVDICAQRGRALYMALLYKNYDVAELLALEGARLPAVDKNAFANSEDEEVRHIASLAGTLEQH